MRDSKGSSSGRGLNDRHDPTRLSAGRARVVLTISWPFFSWIEVVLLFLQNGVHTIIPVGAVPVSCWCVQRPSYLRYRAQQSVLFGLVLAVGIVVDDCYRRSLKTYERKSAVGMAPAEAAHATMDEVGGDPSVDRRDTVRGIYQSHPEWGFRTVLSAVCSHN